MNFSKVGNKVFYKPSTLEIFNCLRAMPGYSKLLAEQDNGKPYNDFLKWLIEKDFYDNQKERITIKKIASDYKDDSAKVTKWIREIYDEIFELNDNKPELFQGEGVKVEMYFKYFDSGCGFIASLSVMPREFETFRFVFGKAKVGVDFFWVKSVDHTIIDNTSIVTLWLQGGIANKYREFVLDKALFQDRIDDSDVYQKRESELDKELNRIYRD